MGPHFPKTAHDSRVESWEIRKGNQPLRAIERTTRHGHTTTRKYRVVCRGCNNGWMARIEDIARPHLIGLMTGACRELSEKARREITRWAVLKTIVLEHERPHEAVIRPDDRKAFMQTGAMPPGVQVWLFRCGESPWDASLHRHCATATVDPTPPANYRAKNTQSVLIGAREVLIYLFQSYTLQSEMRFDEAACRRLWPATVGPATWPPERRARAIDAESIADTIGAIIRDPRTRHM